MTLAVEGFVDVTSLAGGGFGSVYQATRASTGGVVALKVLDRAHGDDEALLERRLRREISALVALKGHPNVVQVEEVVTTSNGPAIVMEFMSRGSVLHSDEPGATSAERVAFVGAAVASGLHAAHEAGIVHRDVKPQNILVNRYGTVKLCDFGIAAIQRSADYQTHTTALSVRYASPEELDGDSNIGAATDMYSLGASLFHLMYGEPPSFRGGRGADPTLTRSRRGENATRDHVSHIIERCLSEDPRERPTAIDCFGLLSNTSGAAVERRAAETVLQRRDHPVTDNDDITAERTPSSPPPPPAPPSPRDHSSPPRRRADDVSAAPVLPQTSDETWWQ